jgi:hypothetical protein
VHVRLTATLAKEGAVPVRACVEVLDVMLIGFRTADGALPSGGGPPHFGHSIPVSSRSICVYDD